MLKSRQVAHGLRARSLEQITGSSASPLRSATTVASNSVGHPGALLRFHNPQKPQRFLWQVAIGAVASPRRMCSVAMYSHLNRRASSLASCMTFRARSVKRSYIVRYSLAIAGVARCSDLRANPLPPRNKIALPAESLALLVGFLRRIGTCGHTRQQEDRDHHRHPALRVLAFLQIRPVFPCGTLMPTSLLPKGWARNDPPGLGNALLWQGGGYAVWASPIEIALPPLYYAPPRLPHASTGLGLRRMSSA